MKFYRQWQPVKAISFDLDDTLYNNGPVLQRAEQQTLSFIQHNFALASQSNAVYWQSQRRAVLQSNPQLKHDMTALRRHTLDKGFAQCGYQGKELQQAVQQTFDYFYHLRSDFTVDKTTCSLLMELKKHVPLVAITNGNVNVDRIGLSGVFSHCFHASREQPMKPAPDMFYLACDALDLLPQDILHVGDCLNSDIYGASKAGFRTAWVAQNRPILLNDEPAKVLPDIQLESLHNLMTLFTQLT